MVGVWSSHDGYQSIPPDSFIDTIISVASTFHIFASRLCVTVHITLMADCHVALADTCLSLSVFLVYSCFRSRMFGLNVAFKTEPRSTLVIPGYLHGQNEVDSITQLFHSCL